MSSLRPLGESYHRLQRLTHPRAPLAMGRSAPSASAPNDSAGKRVPGQAHCPHRDPMHSAPSFITIPSCARLRLRECCTCRSWALYLTAGALTHPACSLVSGFVVPPQSRSCRYASPMLTGGAAQRLMVRPGTLDACAQLVLHHHSLRSPVRSLTLGGIGAVSLGHTLAAVAVLRYTCLRITAHRHRQSTKSPQY